MVWHPLVAALLFGMFHGFVLSPHTAMAAPAAATTAAQEFMAQGSSAWQRGAFEDAVRAWLAAAQHYEQARQPRAQSDALTQLARAYQALGQYRKAVQNLSLALELAQKSGDRTQAAAVLGGLGSISFVTGSLDAAQQAATPDEHSPCAIAADIEERILRECHLTQTRKGVRLEVRRHLWGTGQHFSWRCHARNLHPPTWGHELAAADLDLATYY